jgi:L-iditol 2-dehydrogenase
MIELLKRHSDSRKNIAWENLISRSYTLKDINQALADVEQGSVLKAVIQPNLA